MTLSQVILNHIYIHLRQKYPQSHIIKLTTKIYDHQFDAVLIRVNNKSHYFIADNYSNGNTTLVIRHTNNQHILHNSCNIVIHPMDPDVINDINEFIDKQIIISRKCTKSFSRKKVFGQDISNLTLQKKTAKYHKPTK